MKEFKRFGLILLVAFLCFGCSEVNDPEDKRVELVESFLHTLYNVQYEETSKLYEDMDRQLKGEVVGKTVSPDAPELGEMYPKTFAPYFTEKAFTVSLANGDFIFLPKVTMVKKADYKLQSLKQLSKVEKDGYWDYRYEVEITEIIGDQVTPYTDEVRLYVEDDNGEWKITNVRFFHQDYANPEELAKYEQNDTKNFRKFDDRTLEITKYEMFYRNQFMYSKEAVEFFGLTETIRKYALFHHLEQHDYGWDDETRNKFRERVISAFQYDLQNPDYKAYLEKMYDTLGITAEDYIEYYLLVNKEYEMLHQDVFNKGIGLTEDGAYPSGNAETAYQELIGISTADLDELALQMPEPLEPMEPQPDLPFLSEHTWQAVTTNSDGEYIFIQSMYSSLDLSDPHRYLLFEIERVVKGELSRFTIKRYQDAVAAYENDDSEKMKVAKELAQYLEILERSIDKELY